VKGKNNMNDSVSVAPTTLAVNPPDPFLEEIVMLRGMFEAAILMDDLDLAHTAFYSLCQNAWAAHALRVSDAPLRCPVVPAEAER
jgi:hypothetical protein